MARLAFCDYHNMIVILEKYEHNHDFYQIVDFVEASHIRRNLTLNDEEGINSLPDAEIFENIQLMGYNILPNQKFTFQKGQFTHQWKYHIHTIMQCLSPKSTGFNEFSSNIATALVCLATNRVYNFLKMIFDDEPASPLRDGSQGEACPIDYGFVADQDRANIAKTSTMPSDSTPRVTSLVADEGNLQHKLDELTALCTSLQRQQSEMVAKFEAQEDDAPIKGWSMDEGEEATEKGSNDTEEMINVLTSMDAATVLSSGVAEVPIGSGKEKMIESETPNKKKIQEQMDIQMAKQLEEEMERDAQWMNEQIARDAEIARIHAEEELKLCSSSQIPDSAKKAKIQEAKEGLLHGIWKQIEDFIPMSSKEETERFKRKGLRLEQVSEKKLKTSEEVPEEVKATEEVPEDKVKEMMQLVPIKELYVEALQVKHLIIDWKVHREGQRSYWKITRLGGSSASY
nr:synaptobrevin, longin-like domain protein [Tanacetum cinerariifolium]